MDNNDVQLVGGPCGQHGPYTFYKAFKYIKNGVKRIVTLSEFFFVKLWIDSDLLCIGELQLLWIDKNSDQVLASLRLYFLPENTPEGRMDHGEDEVLAIAEKVVIRVEDLITWITTDAEWTWGRLAKCQSDVKTPASENSSDTPVPVPLTESSLDFSDVEKERKTIDPNSEKSGPSVIILSYPKYCRYRAMMKRLENVENDCLKLKIVNALGGFSVISKNTRILFCRDTFEYPELEGHELLCNHLAPKLKGRPRGKRKKRSVSPGSESNESESSVSAAYTRQKITTEGGRNGLRCDTTTSPRRSTRSADNSESKAFVKKLTSFMKSNQTPIGRIPSLGYKELDLYDFYSKVQKLGGYDAVTGNRLWKSIFDEMSGHQNSTSAATVIRRHYERFLLAYERNIKGEEYKPLPVSERRRLKSKAGSSISDAENSEGTSNSGTSTPVPNTSIGGTATCSTSADVKDVTAQVKTEGKPSSLRSVRVKPERQKEKQTVTDKTNSQNNNNNNNNVTQTDAENIKKEVVEEDIKPRVEKLIIKTEGMIIKSESVKIEPIVKQEIKSEVIEFEKIETIEKDAQPLTSAVAPVFQKVSPEKLLSPLEGKENIPIIKTGDTASSSQGAEIIEVPFKPKSPEIVDLESEAFKIMNNSSINKTPIQNVKRMKLDILKEGGLEVTPVRSVAPPMPSNKDIRPSVIQPVIISPPPSKDCMPPPSMNTIPSKRVHLSVPQAITQSKQSNQKLVNKTPSPIKPFSFNGTPPKVVQSKSIYSYSEKTVYGNPKDCFMPFGSPAHTPKFVGTVQRQSGGDLLDLTVSSPQKPVVEVMRVPRVPSAAHQTPYNRESVTKNLYKSSPSLLDGRRLGPNLEITVVSPTSVNPPQKYNSPSTHLHSSSRYLPQKRVSNDVYYNNKMLKTDDSKYNKHSNPILPIRDHKPSVEISIPTPYPSRSPSIKADPINNHPKTMQPPKNYPVPAAPFPFISNYSQIYDGNKGIHPYLPIIDPVQLAMSLYSNGGMNSQHPILPIPNTEQLKMYADLMYQSRLPFPYPLPQDGNPANNNFKKQ